MPRGFTLRSGIGGSTPSALGAVLQAGELDKANEPFPMLTKPMRVYGLYAVVYLLGGGGRYEDANGRRCAVSAGDMIVVLPKLGHRYGPGAGQSWHEIYLVFDGPVFRLWEKSGLLDASQPVRRLEPVDYWLSRFSSVLSARTTIDASEATMEVCRLQSVLAETMAARTAGEDGDDARWLARASALLETDIDLEAAAAKLAMSYPHFRRRFRKLAGRSPGRFRAERQIERACELMQQRNRPDKVIAAELGFCDEFHFSRRFKQMTGVAPREYRRRLP